MAEAAKLFGLMRREEEAGDDRKMILEAIKKTREHLRLARLSFDNVSDPDLVEASIYEINALQARYSYLLKKAREHGCETQIHFRESLQRNDL